MAWSIEYDIETPERLPGELLEQIKEYLRENVIDQFRIGTVETLMFYSERHGLRVAVSVREMELDGENRLVVEVYSPRGIEEMPFGVEDDQDEYLRDHAEGAWSATIERIRRRTQENRSYMTVEEVHKYFPPFQHVFESGEHSTTFDQVYLESIENRGAKPQA